MKTISTEISKEVKEFLQLNLFSQSYKGIKHEYDYFNNDIDFSIQPNYIIEAAENDLKIISERVKVRNEIKELLVGDVVLLPDGQSVIVSYIWEDTAQTSASGSLHLGSSGRISFSGGLDSGIKKSDLILTEKTEFRTIWIFHEGYAGGSRGVYSKIPFKVYRTKKGADLSGIPQIESLKRKQFLTTCETITRIDGNGSPYTLPVPELFILTGAKDEKINLSGLNFKPYWSGLKYQPKTIKEINTLLQNNSFKGTFYNCGGHNNQLHLKYTTNTNELYKSLIK